MASIYKMSYKAKLPDGTLERRECKAYTIEYHNAAGQRVRVKGYRDLKATQQKAAKLEQAVARGEEGLIDRFKEHKATGLAAHIGAYVADLTAKGRAEMYVYNANRRLRILADACSWATLTDIDANSFIKWREKARRTPQNGPGRTGEVASAETVNQYLETARGFLSWCVSAGRFGSNPLATVAKVTGEARRKRRALSDEQVAKLLDVTPEDQKLFIRVGLATGLRRSELAALKWGDVRLNAIKPYLQLRAEATKARRADRLALPPTLAEDLRKSRPENAGDGSRVFPTPQTLDGWKDALAAAGIAYKDEMGRQADFHAGTRKTLCTRMSKAGLPIAIAMRIMRHTDARLTLVDYTDDEQLGLHDALAAIPEPTTAQAKPQSDNTAAGA